VYAGSLTLQSLSLIIIMQISCKESSDIDGRHQAQIVVFSFMFNKSIISGTVSIGSGHVGPVFQ
jgi:hypothetical protein